MNDLIPGNKAEAEALFSAVDLANLGVVAPHKSDYINRYSMDWLCCEADSGTELKYITFWQSGDGYDNNKLSQWYRGKPFFINGRKYVTAEQYMMSEKALLFSDIDSYIKIMNEPDPHNCKQLGRGVRNFDAGRWNSAFREIIFHGNMAKLQSDAAILAALLETGNAVLVEASPYDDIYGAGMPKEELLNEDGSLRVHPSKWHKEGSKARAQNNLGFVLMGLRDLFLQLMGIRYAPGMREQEQMGFQDE